MSPQSDGTIDFQIDSDAADEVIVVIWLDAETTGDNTFDVDDDGVPTEKFAISGQKNWVPSEASAGAATVTITKVNRNLDYFADATNTYYYDSNDIYRIQGGANLTMAEFESLLTASDIIDVTYDPDEADSSVFEVDTDVVPSPTNVKATVSDTDGDGTADDAVITWTAVNQPDAIYNVYTGDGGDGFESADTQLAETSSTSVTITNAVGKTIFVGAESSTTGEVSTGDNSVSPTTPVDARPALVHLGATVDHDAATVGTVDSGDRWNFAFSEAVSLASDAAVQLTNATGPVFENGINATFTLSDDGKFLVIELTGDSAATYDAVIHAVSGITDADEGGQAILVVDNDLEKGPAEVYADTATTATTEFNVVFNEQVLEASAETTGNYTYSGGTVDSATLAADGRTVTLEVSAAPADGDTLAHTVIDLDAETGTQTGYVLVDATAPTLASATEATETTITVVFSEAVKLAGSASDFWLVGDGLACSTTKEATGSAIAGDDLDDTFTLTIDTDVTAGAYELCVAAGTVEDLYGRNLNAADDVAFTDAP